MDATVCLILQGTRNTRPCLAGHPVEQSSPDEILRIFHHIIRRIFFEYFYSCMCLGRAELVAENPVVMVYIPLSWTKGLLSTNYIQKMQYNPCTMYIPLSWIHQRGYRVQIICSTCSTVLEHTLVKVHWGYRVQIICRKCSTVLVHTSALSWIHKRGYIVQLICRKMQYSPCTYHCCHELINGVIEYKLYE